MTTTTENHASLNRWELENRVMVRAAKDEAFRRQLQEDPRAALEAELGETLPEAITVNLVLEDRRTLKLVVPNPNNTLLGSLEIPANLVGGSGNPTRKIIEARMVAAAGGSAEVLRAQALEQLQAAVPGAIPEDVTLEVIEEPANTIVLCFPHQGRTSYR